MSETTSTIKEILGVRPYEGQHGKTFYFQLEMENGDTGSIGKKSETALKVGDSLTYTLETGERGNKIKPVLNGNSFATPYQGGKPQTRGGNESFALSYSKDYHVALINAGSTGEATSDQITLSILKTADKFLDWLNQNKS